MKDLAFAKLLKKVFKSPKNLEEDSIAEDTKANFELFNSS